MERNVRFLIRGLPDDNDNFIFYEAANKWLATVKTADFEARCEGRLSVVLPTVWSEVESAWPGLVEIAHLKDSCARHSKYEFQLRPICKFS